MKHPGHPVNIHEDNCLCGSGRLMRDCCLFIRCNTTPPSPATGYAHPSCFARDLKDCGGDLSREHYVSRGILEMFGKKGLTVSGMPWIPDGEDRKVSSSSLTGKMLCERHNNALASLDAVAIRFFRFFFAEWTEEKIEVFLTRGYDLERWALKMLCGLVASGNATFDGKRLEQWTPPSEWLDILFGVADIESPAGLHSVVGKYQAARESLHFTPVFKEETALPIALTFALEGIIFLLAMEELPPLRKPSVTGAVTHYRPMGLHLHEGDMIREAHLGWPDGSFVGLDVSDAE